MRSTSIALRAAGVAAALVMGPPVIGAPAARAEQADDPVTVTVHPAEARAGDEVEIRVQGCRGRSGAASSPVFTADARLTGGGPRAADDGTRADEAEERDGGGSGTRSLVGSAAVRSRAAQGNHRITVTCDGRDHRAAGTLRVTGGEPRRDGPSPVAPVRAGGGGTSLAAAGDGRQRPGDDEADRAVGGPSTPQTVIGLLLAGAAGVVVALRSSRRRRTGSGSG